VSQHQSITFTELQKIINGACTCGGEPRGSIKACPACEVYHSLTRSSTAQPTIPNHGTLADYERDVTDAQAAYAANPSSKNASDLHAAKEAFEMRHQ